MLAALFLALGSAPALADGAGSAEVETEVVCMQEAAGFGLNCTANDVSLGTVTNIVITDACDGSLGDTVTFSGDFEMLLTAQARHDVGLWFSSDGDPNGDAALTGTCTAVTPAYAPDPPFLDLDGTNDDPDGIIQDTCGDIDADHNPLLQNFELTVSCIDTDGNGKLELPYCSSWRQPGANDLCTSPSQAFPGAPSKCNCDEGFEVDVPVPLTGTIEVVKSLIPTDDGGRFDLNIDGNPEAIDVGHNGTTGPVVVSAGFSNDPTPIGDTHAVSETAGTDTLLADYNTEVTCTDGVDTVGPTSATTIDVFVEPDDAWVCTFTNELRQGTLTLIKTVDNLGETGPGYLGVSDFPLSIDAVATTSGTTETVLAGDHTIAEIGQPGYTVGTWSCDDNTTGTPGSVSATVNIAPGEDVICDITNTLIADPSITLIKSGTLDVGGDGIARPGDVITYGFTVTNTGNVTLTDVTVTDTVGGVTVTGGPLASLAPGGVDTTTFTGTYAITQTDIDAGTFFNTAEACGLPPAGPEACGPDDEEVPIPAVGSVSVIKYVRTLTAGVKGPWIDANTVTGPLVTSDQKVQFRFRVQNTGNVTLTNVTLFDDTLSACSIPTVLAPGVIVNCIVTAAWEPGQHTNVATVLADSPAGTPVEDSDPANYFGVAEPDISVIKYVRVKDGPVVGPWFDANTVTGPLVPSGLKVQFRFRVQNTGNVTLSDVTLSDDTLAACSIPATLVPGQIVNCIVTGGWEAGQHTNTATVTGDYLNETFEDTDPANYFGLADASISVIKYVRVKTGPVLGPWLDANTLTEGPLVTANQKVQFRYRVQNTGDTPLTNVVLTDDVLAACSIPATLAPGQVVNCIVTAGWEPGAHTNVATVTADVQNDDPVTDTDPANYEGIIDQNVCFSPDAFVTDQELVDPDFLLLPGIPPGLISEVAFDLSLEGGVYEFIWVSFDTHSTEPPQPSQTQEQWFIQLLDEGGGVLYQSPVTEDIPDALDYAFGTFPAEGFEGEAVTLRVIHADPAGDNPNSVTTSCVYIDEVTDPA